MAKLIISLHFHTFSRARSTAEQLFWVRMIWIPNEQFYLHVCCTLLSTLKNLINVHGRFITSKRFTWLEMTSNDFKLTSNDLNWPQMIKYGTKWPQMTSNDLKWSQMTSDNKIWHQMTSNDLQRPQMTVVNNDFCSKLGIVNARLFGTLEFWVALLRKKGNRKTIVVTLLQGVQTSLEHQLIWLNDL